jgi:hypothetical protein
MVKLTQSSIIIIVGAALALCAFCMWFMLRLRREAAEKETLCWLTKMSSRTLIFRVLAFSGLILIIILGGRIYFSKKDISSLLVNLKNCEKIEIHDSFLDFANGGSATAKITISDPNIIDKLFTLMSRTKYRRELQLSRISTPDIIKMNLYKKGTKIGYLEMVFDYLITGKDRSKRVYRCFVGDDFLLYEARKVIFPKRQHDWNYDD